MVLNESILMFSNTGGRVAWVVTDLYTMETFLLSQCKLKIKIDASVGLFWLPTWPP